MVGYDLAAIECSGGPRAADTGGAARAVDIVSQLRSSVAVDGEGVGVSSVCSVHDGFGGICGEESGFRGKQMRRCSRGGTRRAAEQSSWRVVGALSEGSGGLNGSGMRCDAEAEADAEKSRAVHAWRRSR
jgi:hypothetical protein